MKTKLILDINKTQHAQLNSIVTGRVGDKASNIVDVYVIDNGTPYNLTGNTVFFECVKPDNTVVRDDNGVKIIDAAKGHFEYTFPTETFGAIGKAKQAFMSIEKDKTVRATTQDFVLITLPDATTNRIPSESYVSDLEKLIKELNEMALEEINSQAAAEASAAKDFANKANDLSISIQKQLDTIVINGDSSVEAAQARTDINGNSSRTLKERLDKEQVKVDKLSEMANKPKTIEQVIEKMIKKELVTIVCYGDSITFGYIPGSGAQTPNTYPSHLQTLLRDYYGYSGITVINKGNSGKRSYEFASDAYVKEVISLNPDMIIFMTGINDCRGSSSGGPIIPVKDYKYNIALMISKLNYPFIFMTPTFFQDTEETKSRFVQYVSAMGEMAKKLSVKLIDLNTIVLNDLEIRELSFSDIAPDNIHYIDEYYKRLAEFVFTFGLCNNDIVVKQGKFINPLDNLFRWKLNSNYYTSPINPMKRNIILDNTKNELENLTIYLFADEKKLALQSLYIPNYNTSPSNTIEVNGVVFSQPIPSPGQTIWKLREQAIPLVYGLNKIVYKTSNAVSGKTLQLIYGVNIIKTDSIILGDSKKLSGKIYINAETTGVQKRTKLLTMKDNDFKKISVKFTPSAIDSGIAFGTGLVIYEGKAIEYPLSVVLYGGGRKTKLYDFKMNHNNALYNVDGKLNFGELFSSDVAYNLNVENTLTITLSLDEYVFELNGVLLFTLPKTTYNIGVLDVWGYSISTSPCTVNEITVSR